MTNMNLFNHTINDWKSWENLFQSFQSIDAFSPLIEKIFAIHNLPMDTKKIQNLAPSTNAVFRVGDYVAKILVPEESGFNTESDYNTEIFGMNHAAKNGVPIPEVIACGSISDKYFFRYIVMKYIDGEPLSDVRKYLSPDEKFAVGKEIRKIIRRLNVKTERFNDIDVFGDAEKNERWDKFSDKFNAERIEFIRRNKNKPLVYVHGDLHAANIIIDRSTNNKIYIIDFADSYSAPHEYELPSTIFSFICGHGDAGLAKGFLDGDDIQEFAERCFFGLMLHDFGADIIGDIVAHQDINSIKSIYEVKELILQKFFEI